MTHLLFTGAMCFLVLLAYTGGIKVRLYNSINYVDFFYEMNIKQGCNNLEMYAHDRAVSIQSDSCVMIYKHFSCEGMSLKITPGSDLGKDLGFIKKSISSIQNCNENEGGYSVNVDIYEKQNYQKLKVRYNDVCECTVIPKDTHGTVGSLDNHGNCVDIFRSHDCTGDKFSLKPGKSPQSGSLIDLSIPRRGWYSRMKSFQPCELPDGCLRLQSSVFKFEIAPSFNQDNVGEKLLAQKTSFRNNGQAKLTREYTAKNTINESYRIEESTKITATVNISTESVATVGVSNTAEVSAAARISGVGVKAKNALTLYASNTLKKVYESSRQNTTQKMFSYYTENQKEFSVSERIEIPPCTEYEVNSVVKYFKDVPIEYQVYSKISGYLGAKQLTASELRDKIKDFMAYVEDFDEWTVIVKMNGTMKATLGFESITNGHGFPIPECSDNSTGKTLDEYAPRYEAWQTFGSASGNVYYIVLASCSFVISLLLAIYIVIQACCKKSYQGANEMTHISNARKRISTYFFSKVDDAYK